jgi:hypothetical protein
VVSPGGLRQAAGLQERAFAKAAFLLATAGAAFALLDAAWLHAGIEAWDQVKVLGLVQELNEGADNPWRFGGGQLYLAASQAALALFGPTMLGLRLPNLAFYAVECLLLWRLGSRLGGPAAGLGAVALNALAAFTWIRLRSLLGFVIVPTELLLALWLTMGPGRWRALAVGAVCGLALFDYEAWVLALPVVALWWAAQPRLERPSAAWALLGFAAVLPFLAMGSAGTARNYAWVRLGPNLQRPLMQAFAEFGHDLWRFATGQGRADLLLEAKAALPWFSLPLLALGALQAWREQRLLLAWLALGMLPMAALSAVAEANRAIVAWPALCLLGGLGLAWAWQRVRERAHAGAALGALILVGGAVEAQAYLRMQDRVEPLARSYWRRVELAAQVLRERAQQAPIQVLDGLNWRAMPEWRALIPSAAGAEEVWAVVPPDYAPFPLEPRWGRWHELKDPVSGSPFYLLQLAPEAVKLFAQRSEALNAFRATAAARFDGPGLMAAVRQALDGPLGADPWTRRALLDMHLNTALEARSGPEHWLPLLLAEEQLSVVQACIAAVALEPSDPQRALALVEGALAQDPRRESVHQLRKRLRAAVDAARSHPRP